MCRLMVGVCIYAGRVTVELEAGRPGAFEVFAGLGKSVTLHSRLATTTLPAQGDVLALVSAVLTMRARVCVAVRVLCHSCGCV